MILIGQYDSPFVRRVAIAMRIYNLRYDHRPWSTFTDVEKIRRYNPLTRVPTLVLEDGVVLVESGVILDFLDETVGPGRALNENRNGNHRHASNICSFATGLADKAVSLIYERALHTSISEVWITRCERQIRDTLHLLEADRSTRNDRFWFGGAIGHADIAVACALGLIREAHPHLFDGNQHSALNAHAKTCESLPQFRETFQSLVPPPQH
jgi:glutathione S-transferase